MDGNHPLDRAVWNALSGRQAAVSVGDGRARRFALNIGPLTAAADDDPQTLAALAKLPVDETGLYLLQPDPVAAPPGLMVMTSVPCVQMVAGDLQQAEPDFEVIELGDADAVEMLALAQLTKPGPFAIATHRLGQFIGVRLDGELVAMAGERMKPPGFTEVSGVCTHPDHRGHGYAGTLSCVVAQRIVARSETPFLHTYTANENAIRLYEALGFSFRRAVMLTVLGRA